MSDFPHFTVDLSEYSLQQRERLKYIDFMLRDVGSIFRSNIVEQFEVGPATATRDFALYRTIAPKNADFDSQAKRYVRAAGFVPLVVYPAQKSKVCCPKCGHTWKVKKHG